MVRNFRSPWVDKNYEVTGMRMCAHHDMINLTLARETYKEGEVILFVDHDICFDNWPFRFVYDTFDRWFSEDPNLLLAHTMYDYPNKYDRNFKFRTNPLFAVRKNPRMITHDWRATRDKFGNMRDTGRILCANLEKERKTRFIEINPPGIHLHCLWIFKNNYDEQYAKHVVNVMRDGAFCPSEEELMIMKQYPAFRGFIDLLNKRDSFDPL